MAKKTLILDVGAGDRPVRQATHAIDTEMPKKVEWKGRLEEYRQDDFQKPPKAWKGLFDKIVSRYALGVPKDPRPGYPKYFSSVEKTGKALDFVTKPDATLEIRVGSEHLPQAKRILNASSFKTMSIEPVRGPHGGMLLTGHGKPAEFTITAQKGIGYASRGGRTLSRSHRKGFKKVRFT